MQNKDEFLKAIRQGSQTKVNEIIEKEMKSHVAEELEQIEESVAKNLLKEETNYEKVFYAIADHFGFDPENLDELDDEEKKEFFNMLDKCWDEDSDEITSSCPIDIMGESVKNPSSTSLHGSGGQVDGPSKSKQKSAASAAEKMMQMQATNFNQMMSQVYSQNPEKARGYQDMIANNPGEQTMNKIATDMMDDSDLARIMKQYLDSNFMESANINEAKGNKTFYVVFEMLDDDTTLDEYVEFLNKVNPKHDYQVAERNTDGRNKNIVYFAVSGKSDRKAYNALEKLIRPLKDKFGERTSADVFDEENFQRYMQGEIE